MADVSLAVKVRRDDERGKGAARRLRVEGLEELMVSVRVVPFFGQYVARSYPLFHEASEDLEVEAFGIEAQHTRLYG